MRSLRWKDLGGGYWQVLGGLLQLIVVEIDRACESEGDDYLRLFSHHEVQTEEAQQFWAYLVGMEESGMEKEKMEDYDQVMQRLLSRMKPEQILLALPDDALRALSEEYLATLSEPTRAAIRQRLGR